MNERERIGKIIAEIRISKGMSQTDVANASGLDRGHIARIELGRYNVGVDTLGKIADALGCTIVIAEK